jgi:hypothetical protein
MRILEAPRILQRTRRYVNILWNDALSLVYNLTGGRNAQHWHSIETFKEACCI